MSSANEADYPQYLTLCAIVKDEDDYLLEWVAFHLAAGVDKFLIIDNGSSSRVTSILSKFISAGIVEVVRFHSRIKPQREAYNRALRYLEGKSRWVGFFDVDEFVFPVNEESLKAVLADFTEYAGLAVNWVAYGSSGHEKKPKGWVIENFTNRGPLDHVVELPAYELPQASGCAQGYRQMNTHVKCFVDPARTELFRTAHHFKFAAGEHAVTETGQKIDGPFSDGVSVKRIRVNHYWSKSLEELNSKLKKGRVSQVSGEKTSGYPVHDALVREMASRGVNDTSALRFLGRAQEIAEQFRPDVSGAVRPEATRRLRYSPANWIRAQAREIGGVLRRVRRKFPLSGTRVW